jgi:hypothetical protein
LLSLEISLTAHILVEQQTSNINMDQIISIQDQILLPTVHPVDASLFFYKPDARSFLQFLQRSASESRISKFQSTSNGFLNKNLHLSNTVLPSNKLEGKAINNFNRDNMKPITAENVKRFVF